MTDEIKEKIASLYLSEKKRATTWLFKKRMVRDLNEAENLIHDAIFSMLNSKTIKDYELKAFFYTCLRNNFINRYRRERKLPGVDTPMKREENLNYIEDKYSEEENTYPITAEQCVSLLHPIKDKNQIKTINLKLKGLMYKEFNDGVEIKTHRTRYHFGVKKIKVKLGLL